MERVRFGTRTLLTPCKPENSVSDVVKRRLNRIENLRGHSMPSDIKYPSGSLSSGAKPAHLLEQPAKTTFKVEKADSNYAKYTKCPWMFLRILHVARKPVHDVLAVTAIAKGAIHPWLGEEFGLIKGLGRVGGLVPKFQYYMEPWLRACE